MSDIEIALTDLGEVATRELTNELNPLGLDENKIIANKGGKVSKTAKSTLEKELNKSVIKNKNNLNYKYIDEDKLLETK